MVIFHQYNVQSRCRRNELRLGKRPTASEKPDQIPELTNIFHSTVYSSTLSMKGLAATLAFVRTAIGCGNNINSHVTVDTAFIDEYAYDSSTGSDSRCAASYKAHYAGNAKGIDKEILLPRMSR
jgi:hypothetical protein